MARGYSRTQRVSELIQAALADILQKEVKDLRIGMITVTSVSISHDLSFAKIFVSVLEEDKATETIATLNRNAKNLRYLLANAVKLRIAPELRFIYDDSSVRGHRISSLIKDALDKK